jgi:hypothetical protein
MSPRSRGEPRGQRHLRGHADGPRGRILGACGPEFEAPRVRPHHLALSMRCRPGTVDSRSEIEQLSGATSAHRLRPFRSDSALRQVKGRAFPCARESHQFAAVALHLIGRCADTKTAKMRPRRVRRRERSGPRSPTGFGRRPQVAREETAVPFWCVCFKPSGPGRAEPIRCGWGRRRAAGRRRGSTAAPCRPPSA